MKFIPIKTRRLIPPKDQIYTIIDAIRDKIKEGDIILVTSKVVAIDEGRCVLMKSIQKEKLILNEAEYVLHRKGKNHILSYITHSFLRQA